MIYKKVRHPKLNRGFESLSKCLILAANAALKR